MTTDVAQAGEVIVSVTQASAGVVDVAKGDKVAVVWA